MAIGDAKGLFELPIMRFLRFQPNFRQFWPKFDQFINLKDPRYPKTGKQLYSYVFFNHLLSSMAIEDGKGSFELPKV